MEIDIKKQIKSGKQIRNKYDNHVKKETKTNKRKRETNRELRKS